MQSETERASYGGSFVTLSMPSARDADYDNSKRRRNISMFRKWKSLSSLQRTLILVLACLLAVTVVTIWRTINFVSPDVFGKGHQPHKEVAKELQLLKRLPNKNAIFERNLVELQELEKKYRKPKRGPPRQVAGDRKEDRDYDNQEENQRINHNELRGDTNGNHVDDVGRNVEAVDTAGDGEMKRLDETKEVNKINGVYILPKENQNEKQRAVVGAFQHAWKAYKQHAWGHDELKPLSRSYSEWFQVGLTIIDSLDTMFLMNLKSEFQEARNWIATSLSFNKNIDVNLFEITIRVLGGLLSTYHLSKDDVFLQKAIDLGDRLLPCFNSRSKVPYSDVNLLTRRAHAPRWGPDSSVSEVSTIQIEFRDLSFVTGDPKYKEAVDKVANHLHKLPKKNGLVPIFVNADTGQFRSSATITLGARGDSYYEYLLKQWLQTGKKENSFKEDFIESMEGVMSLLARKSKPNNLLFVGELLRGQTFSPKMDHLVCFLPGTMALATLNGLGSKYMDFAKEMIETCYQMYVRMPAKLSPEIAYFNQVPVGSEDIIVKQLDAHNLLRPETVESLFLMYRITKDKKYQEYGWQIFQAFEKHARISSGGYSSLNSVKNLDLGYRDKMESFFLGETLKYFFLLFSDTEIVPLDKFVFNTEAHAFPIRES